MYAGAAQGAPAAGAFSRWRATMLLSRADTAGGKDVRSVNIARAAGAQPTVVQIAGKPLVVSDPQVTVRYADAADALTY